MNRNQIHTRTTSMAALIFRGVLADPWSRIRPAMWLAEEEYSFNNRDIDFYRNRYRYRERKRRRRDETSAEKVRSTQEEEEELKEERKSGIRSVDSLVRGAFPHNGVWPINRFPTNYFLRYSIGLSTLGVVPFFPSTSLVRSFSVLLELLSSFIRMINFLFLLLDKNAIAILSLTAITMTIN